MAIGQQPILYFGDPLVEPRSGLVALPWQRFFLSLWLKSGGSHSTNSGSVYLQQNGAVVQIFDAGTGNLLGTLSPNGSGGQAAVPIAVGASPFVYTATADGFVLANSGKLELSRNTGVTYYQFSLTGGSSRMRTNDKLRLTWFGATVPLLTFMPD